MVGDDLPGAVVVRAEGDGPPVNEWDEDETSVKPADDSESLRFSLAGVQMKFSAVGYRTEGLATLLRGKGVIGSSNCPVNFH